MMINIVFPLEFVLKTQICSIDINISEQDLTYRKMIEVIAQSFREQAYDLILCDHEIMVVIIVDNKRVDPDDPARDGERIVLMLPLEGG